MDLFDYFFEKKRKLNFSLSFTLNVRDLSFILKSEYSKLLSFNIFLIGITLD